MTRMTFLLEAFVIAAVVLVPLPAKTAAQAWQSFAVSYADNKNKGMFTAQYKILRQRKGCRMTIRLINNIDRNISSYWFTFTFTEGGKHESRMTDHPAGEVYEWNYEKCGLKNVRIPEIE